MRYLFCLLMLFLLAGCGPADDCSDMVGSWEGKIGTVVVKRTGDTTYSFEFPATGRKNGMSCKAAVMTGTDTQIRATINSAGKLVIDGLPGGLIESFSRKG